EEDQRPERPRPRPRRPDHRRDGPQHGDHRLRMTRPVGARSVSDGRRLNPSLTLRAPTGAKKGVASGCHARTTVVPVTVSRTTRPVPSGRGRVPPPGTSPPTGVRGVGKRKDAQTDAAAASDTPAGKPAAPEQAVPATPPTGAPTAP